LAAGRIDASQLQKAVHAQVLDILREVLVWPEGAFLFDDHEPPFEVIDDQLISTQSVILEAARITDEDSYVESLFPDVDVILSRTDTEPSAECGAKATEVLSIVDGSRSVKDVLSHCADGASATAVALRELLDLGMVRGESNGQGRESGESMPGVRSWPVSPEVPGLLFATLANEQLDADAITRVLAGEPMLTAKVLRILTLCTTEIRRDSMSISNLSGLLGEFQVRSLLLPEAARGMFYPVKSYWSDLWDHAKVCAQLSRYLATQTSYPFPGEAYLAGLLHNLGAFILFDSDPTKYHKVVAESIQNRRDVEEVENEYFGRSHCEVGKVCAERWNFPRLLKRVIRDHHSGGGGKTNQLDHIVVVANGLAQASGYRVGYHQTLGAQFEESLNRLKLDRQQASALYQRLLRPNSPTPVVVEEVAG